jgi:hypothetical protein
MASHANSSNDTVSVAKLGLYGTIGAAIISAVTTTVVGVLNNNGSDATVSNGPPPTTITPTAIQVSDRGSANQFVISATGEVTVSGSAQEDVNGMFVLIGPKPSGGYWGSYANVVNEQWQADVATDPPWQNYTISAYPYYASSGGAAPSPGAPPAPNTTSQPAVPAGRLVSETASQSALKFAFQPEPTTPPPPPPVPDDLLNCAVQFGPSCFTGPGFGPPSVYQPKQ